MKHRPLRRSRAHLDDLLDGRVTSGDPLGELVAAVRAPAQPNELVGLDAAVAAFVSAASVAPSPEEKTPMLKSVAGRLLALKILAVVAGTAAAGGVAYAAVSDNVITPHGNSAAASHHPGQGDDSDSDDSSGSSSAESSDSDEPSGSDTGSESGSGSESASGSDTGSPSSSPSPSLRGLCTAWLAHPQNDSKLSTNPAFSVLVTAAGGMDAVNGYCTTLLASVAPSHPAHPTQAQNTKSHGPKSSHPAQPTQANDTKSPNPHKPTARPTQAQNTKSHSAPANANKPSSS
jgi:hypothetical protein